MAIPGISLGNDALGLGAMWNAALFNADVSGCGNRPRLPGKSRRAWDECVARQQDLQGKSLDTQLAGKSLEAQNKPNNTLIIIGLVVAVIVLILILRKK